MGGREGRKGGEKKGWRERKGGDGRGGRGGEGEEGWKEGGSKHSSLWQREEWKEDANGLLHGTLTLAVCVVGRGSVGRAAGWNIQS